MSFKLKTVKLYVSEKFFYSEIGKYAHLLQMISIVDNRSVPQHPPPPNYLP